MRRGYQKNMYSSTLYSFLQAVVYNTDFSTEELRPDGDPMFFFEALTEVYMDIRL